MLEQVCQRSVSPVFLVLLSCSQGSNIWGKEEAIPKAPNLQANAGS